MKKSKNLSLSICALALILSGCGGSGSSNTMTGDTEPPVHTPTLAEVYSSDSAPDQPFSVDSASVIRNKSMDTTSVPDDMEMELSVSSVRRNTGGGYDITYLIDGVEKTVQFLPEHCDEMAMECQIPGHSFWTMLTPVRGGGQLDPTTFMEYFSIGHLDTNVTNSAGSDIQQRQMFVFGVETPAAAVPTQGVAIYTDGYFRADAYRQNSSSGDFRQRYSGSMQIVANFDMSSLDGQIFSVRGSEPGSS